MSLIYGSQPFRWWGVAEWRGKKSNHRNDLREEEKESESGEKPKHKNKADKNKMYKIYL